MFQSTVTQETSADLSATPINTSQKLSSQAALLDDLMLFQSDVEVVYRDGRSLLASYWMQKEKSLKANKARLEKIR
ncbi:MAG: hypothetical protein OXE99_14765 [Cellvibrionales bacterium]|nr:hypothetical protein [Cellvibrionales bacterium]